MTMTKKDVHPGFIGMSRGDTTINAIILGADDEFYFYPVTVEQAKAVEDWNLGAGWSEDLEEILPDASPLDIDMFLYGERIDD